MKQSALILAASLLALSTMASAHHAWIEPAPEDGFRILWGHTGHAGTYDPSYVVGVTLLGTNGRVLDTSRSDGNKGVLVHAQESTQKTVGLAAFTFDSGNTIKTAEGQYVHGSKQDYEDYARAFHAVITGKSLFAWHPDYAQGIGLELEIVPLENPYTLETNEPLPIQVLYQGEPLNNAQVHYVTQAGKPGTATTNAKGRASLAIDTDTLRIITVSHSVALPDNEDVDARSVRSYLYIYPQQRSASEDAA